MIYLSDFHKFNENNPYYIYKKDEPINYGTMDANIRSSPAIETGIVLILSNTFAKDGMKRIYMGIIDRVREDNESDTVRVDLLDQFYILKEQQDGTILPEKVLMNREHKLAILNMKNNGLYLNDNKTPLWRISCTVNKINFFTKYQALIKNILIDYPIVYPFTQSKNKISLH